MTTNPLALPASCPAWCTTEHGVFADDADWLHTGAPLYLTEGVTARLCATVNPATGATDGPYLIVDGEEWTLEHARTMGEALVALAVAAASPTGTTGPHLV